MSVRWMAVQYVGNTLVLPIANAEDMGEPVGTSVTERDVSRVIVNTSAGRKTFVPDDNGDRMRELIRKMRYGATWTREAREYIEAQMQELGIEVD